MKKFLPVLMTSLLSAIIAIGIYKMIEEPQQVIIRESVPVVYASENSGLVNHAPSRQFISSSPTDFIAAADRSKPAVVYIESRVSSQNFWGNDSYGSSTGSGVVISSDGYIATNNHVVEGGKNIVVTLNDKREFKAKIVGADPTTDLARLKIDQDELDYLPFGNSDSLQVGEWVLAVGNPFRLQSTVTAGIVSAKGRNINILQDAAGIESFIQTDAAVNPGNSGGALVNTNGELIGINTAIITYSGQYEGFSFAVPANLAKKVMKDIKEFGSVQRGWLGVEITPIDDRLANDLKLEKVSGILLTKVNENSAAEDAGLKINDVVVSVNEVETAGTPEFMETVGQFRPGDKLQLGYIRDGKLRSAQVILGNNRNTAIATNITPVEPEDDVSQELGFTVRDLNSAEKSRLKSNGILVEKIFRGGKIDGTNMEEDYIITEINGEKVDSKTKLLEALATAKGMVVLKGFYEKYPGEYPYAFHIE